MPARAVKKRPPVVRPFVYKFPLGSRSLFGTGCTFSFVWPIFQFFPLETQKNKLKINVCLLFVGSIFPVAKAKSWAQTDEELASLEIAETW